MTVSAVLAVLILVMLPGQVLADCFRANHDDGELKFIGEAEGNTFTGHFGEFEVSLCMHGLDLATAGIEVVVKTASADTGDSRGNRELHGENFFDVEQYPEATWKSDEIRPEGDAYVADGELTLRGVTAEQPVRLHLANGKTPTLTGSAEIMRLDWDVGTGDEDVEDTDFIRNRVDLEFELELQPYSKG